MNGKDATATGTGVGRTAVLSATDLAELQLFYAEQSRLLDEGGAEEWARTFTEDGVFFSTGIPAPVRGRTAITEGRRRATAESRAAGVQRRHVFGVPSVRSADDGSLVCRLQVLVVSTADGAAPQLRAVCMCEDVLVRENGVLLIRKRTVAHDGTSGVERDSTRRS